MLTVKPPGKLLALAAASAVRESVAERSEAVPRLGWKWPNPAPRNDRARGLVDEPQFTIRAQLQEPTDEGLETRMVGRDIRQ
jgi:hypothetical protein